MGSRLWIGLGSLTQPVQQQQLRLQLQKWSLLQQQQLLRSTTIGPVEACRWLLAASASSFCHSACTQRSVVGLCAGAAAVPQAAGAGHHRLQPSRGVDAVE